MLMHFTQEKNMNTEMKIPINEIFNSIQGEGPEIGTPTTFIRVYGCDIKPKCTWCDTPYSWSDAKTNRNLMSMSELMMKIFESESHHFTITGGEPTLYEKQLTHLRRMINAQHMSLETNGTRLTSVKYDTIVVSPKEQDVNYEALRGYALLPNAFFKFVYEPGKEQWWKDVADEVGMPHDRVYVMPEGITREQQLSRMEEVSQFCIDNKFKFSPRLHILTWDTKRGV